MNNSDMPAMPQTIEPSDNLERQSQSLGLECNSTHYLGLTKREHFAGLAMQGLLANELIVDVLTGKANQWVAEHSVLLSDALLKELGK